MGNSGGSFTNSVTLSLHLSTGVTLTVPPSGHCKDHHHAAGISWFLTEVTEFEGLWTPRMRLDKQVGTEVVQRENSDVGERGVCHSRGWRRQGNVTGEKGLQDCRLDANINIIITVSSGPPLPSRLQAKVIRATHRVKLHLGVYWERAEGPDLGCSCFFGDALGGGKLLQARGRTSHQGGWRDEVGVVVLAQVPPHFGFGQGDDAGTGHRLLGGLQHLPACVSVRNTLVRLGLGHWRGREKGVVSEAGAWGMQPPPPPPRPAEISLLGQSSQV